MNAELK